MNSNNELLHFGSCSSIRDFEWDCAFGVIRLGTLHLIAYSVASLLNPHWGQAIYPERLKVIQVAMVILLIPYLILFRNKRELKIKKTPLNWAYGVIMLSWINLVVIGLFTGFFRGLAHYLSDGRDLHSSFFEAINTFSSHFLSRIPSTQYATAPIVSLIVGYIFIIHFLPNWKKHTQDFSTARKNRKKQKNMP